MTQNHHPVFARFADGKGPIPNWVGATTRRSFFTPDLAFVSPSYPPFDEQYFEWVDVLEAVTRADEHFTMLELGAGFGRWIVNAAAALRSFSDLPYTLVAVEAEPTHYRWLKQHCRDNGIRRRDRQGQCRLVRAAVAGTDTKVSFAVGTPSEWYGQAVVPEGSGVPTARVGTVTLSSLLKPHSVVDLIHVDVQGLELEIFEEAREELSGRVRRVCIGTHNHEVEQGLRELFDGIGWLNVNDYSSNREHDTPWGRMSFQDGVQTWIPSDRISRA